MVNSEYFRVVVRVVLWLFPVVAGISLAVTVQSTTPGNGVVLALVVPSVVAVAGFVVTDRWTPVPQVALLFEAGVASVLTALIVAQTLLWPAPWQPRDAAYYFGRVLTVAVDGDRAGWSLGHESGFDVALARFIAETYGYSEADGTLQWREVSSRERFSTVAPATTGVLDQHENGDGGGGADIVVSTASITSARTTAVDFTRPYWADLSGVWANKTKVNSTTRAADDLTVCVESDTTASGPLGAFSRSVVGAHVEVVELPTIDKCLMDFRDPLSDVAYVATDWSIVRSGVPHVPVADGFDTRRPVQALKDAEPLLASAGGGEYAVQWYGVALRDGNAAVCRELGATVDSFLENRFNAAFDADLAEYFTAVGQDWHHPDTVAVDDRDRDAVDALVCA